MINELLNKYSFPFFIIIMLLSMVLFLVFFLMGYSEKYDAKEVVTNSSTRDDFLGDLKYRFISLIFLAIAIVCAVHLYKNHLIEFKDKIMDIIDFFK